MTAIDLARISANSIPNPAIALIGFQRTSQISRDARQAWEEGDRSLLEAEAAQRRDEIFSGALKEIYEEFTPISDALALMGRKPAHVIDIGCGQALNDALMVKAYDPRITLIDIEETKEQYHSWNSAGAGYASLAVAKAFLEENGARDVTTINPRETPDALSGLSGDLVTSLISCGFHYPIGEYLPLMLKTIRAGGVVILDLRTRYFKAPDAALTELLENSRQITLSTLPRRRRILFAQ
ncbi:hypothetical protein FGG78_03820 [Thioclava sp. BHET1]|nr:hypothetical protein FGG78_03820 [Thioclava sp. BHET1]